MPLLALHGFSGRGSDFAPLAKLCGGDWLCPDLPGHGPEPPMDCSPQAMIGFIDGHYSKLNAEHSTSNAERSKFKILLGYSMGARAALLHATRHPHAWDALILISPNPGIEDEAERSQRRKQDAALADRIEREGLQAFLKYWQNTPLIRSQQTIRTEWLQAMQQSRLQHQTVGLANSLRQFGQGSMPNLWPDIQQLKMPICLLTGSLDSKYTQLAERLQTLTSSHSTHTVIEHSAHMPQLENAEATAKIICNFLNADCSS